MNRERWERLQELHTGALDLPADRREAFLEKACAGDEGLLKEILELLAEPPEQFMSPPHSPEDVRFGELFGFGLAGRILGDYRLVEELGSGGMGVVYLAVPTDGGDEVAIKILPRIRGSGDARERFEREIGVVSTLEHPRIVPIIARGDEEGIPWYAMRFVEGHDLEEELSCNRAASKGTYRGPNYLTKYDDSGYVRRVAESVAELADAVQFAHDGGVIHRDLKPSNILVDREGRAYLADFGLARDERFGRLTKTDEVHGTLSYMSPEQAHVVKSPIDGRTDVYSLSVVLYEMLTLHCPFDGTSAREVLDKISTASAPPVRRLSGRVPRDLALICEKGMSKSPRHRYATAAEMSADLRRFLRHESVLAKPPGWMRRSRGVVERRWRWLAAALVLFAVSWSAIQYGEVRASQRRSEAAADHLLEMGNLEDWSAFSFKDLADIQESLNLVAEEEERTELVGHVSQRLQEHRRSMEANAMRTLDLGLRTQTALKQFDEDRVLDAILLLGDVQRLFGAIDRDVFRTRLDVQARLTTGEPLSGAVSVAELDPVLSTLGEARSLGPLPLRDARLKPGYYRIAVCLDGFPHREYTRLVLRGGEPINIDCRVDPLRDPVRDMVLVEGGVLNLGLEKGKMPPYGTTPTQVGPFLLDEAAVSVGEFLEYLRDRNLEPPLFWREVPDAWRTLVTGPYADHPMVGVSWGEAQGYAEWAGKRLPTALERDFAGRGAGGASVPYPVQAGEAALRGNVFHARSSVGLRSEMADDYFLKSAPVRSHEEARSVPGGFYHLLGNVYELTESLGEDFDGTEYVPRLDDRMLLGAPWYAETRQLTLMTRFRKGAGASEGVTNVGFRCARSLHL